MKIWKDGDTTVAICPACQQRTEIEFQRRDYVTDRPEVVAKRVLLGICTTCDGIAVFPRQSTPKLRESLAQADSRPVNVRLPGHLQDILEVIADEWQTSSRTPVASLMRLLLNKFATDVEFAKRVRSSIQSNLAEGAISETLSVRVPEHILVGVDQMADLLELHTRSDVIRGLIVAAKEDILDHNDPDLEDRFKRAMMALA